MMRRSQARRTVLTIVLAAAAAAWLLWPRLPQSVPLATIATHQQQWEGTRVTVAGRLLQFQDPSGAQYGVIQGAGDARIGIRDLRPWRALVGHPVRATGTVRFDPKFGLYLAEPHLTPTR